MSNIMSYRFSYPLYLDVTDGHNKQNQMYNRINGYQREGNTSPTTALINLNAFYETMLANGQNSALLNARSHVSSLGIKDNTYYSSQSNASKKLSQELDSSKSSFSIEAILGLNNRPNDNYLTANHNNKYDFNSIKYRSDYSLSDDMSSKPNSYPKAKSVASVSPDSTANELNSFRYNQRTKIKTLATNGLQTNHSNKRSIDCVESSEIKANKSMAKIDINQRVVHNSLPQTKSKRVRTIFTPEQLDKLEAEFERQQYMVGPERLYLASALNLSEAQVKVWFQNRRIKWRKQHLEMEQTRLKKQYPNSEQVTPNEDTERDSSSAMDFEGLQPLENETQFLCHSSNSVEILH